MKKEDYAGLVDFGKFAEKIKKEGMLYTELAAKTGLSDSALGNIARNRYVPTTETLAVICAGLECSADELVTFRGYEVKPYYKGKEPFVSHVPAADELYSVSYAPLRNLFRTFYGDESWMVKLDQYIKKVPSVEIGEAEQAKVERMILARFGPEVSEKICVRNRREGLPDRIRLCIINDRPMNIRYLYNMCMTLGCSPAFVISYK